MLYLLKNYGHLYGVYTDYPYELLDTLVDKCGQEGWSVSEVQENERHEYCLSDCCSRYDSED